MGTKSLRDRLAEKNRPTWEKQDLEQKIQGMVQYSGFLKGLYKHASPFTSPKWETTKICELRSLLLEGKLETPEFYRLQLQYLEMSLEMFAMQIGASYEDVEALTRDRAVLVSYPRLKIIGRTLGVDHTVLFRAHKLQRQSAKPS